MVLRKSFNINHSDDNVRDIHMFICAFSWNIFNELKEFLIDFYHTNGKYVESIWRKDKIQTVVIRIDDFIFKYLIRNF